jgi:hypothetical protein
MAGVLSAQTVLIVDDLRNERHNRSLTRAGTAGCLRGLQSVDLAGGRS